MKRLIMLVCLTVAGSAVARVWTSEDGRRVDAELKSYTSASGTVVLVKKGGREFTLNAGSLSAKDNEYLHEVDRLRIQARQDAKEKEKAAAEAAADLAGTTVSFTTDGTYDLSYHCYYPKNYAGGKLPVLILFSPGGRGKGVMKSFLPVGDKHNWLIVGCDKFGNNMDDDLLEKWFEEMLPHIEKSVPLNSDLMYLGGMSGGALRAYQYSAMFDRPWKGIIACGGWLGGSEGSGLKYRKKMAVAMVNGDADDAANGWVEGDTDVLEGRRCNVKLFQFSGGHTVGPSEVLDEAVEWVIEHTTHDT